MKVEENASVVVQRAITLDKEDINAALRAHYNLSPTAMIAWRIEAGHGAVECFVTERVTRDLTNEQLSIAREIVHGH